MLKRRIEARQRHRSDAGEAHVTLFQPDAGRSLAGGLRPFGEFVFAFVSGFLDGLPNPLEITRLGGIPSLSMSSGLISRLLSGFCSLGSLIGLSVVARGT
jgi:hypothetical protein